MTRILGIDPGSRQTGYGLIETVGSRTTYLACGTIATQGSDMAPRLGQIFAALVRVVEEWRPDEVAVERVFMARNADSALKLGQARGAAIAAVVQGELQVFEYTARQVKQALVGTGAAEKAQVADMVRRLLLLDRAPQADAADALGIAICHAHMRVTLARMAQSTSVRYRRAR